MSSARWIWYPGDFELYHGMRQNFEREERGMGWPAFWKMDDWRKNVRFFRHVQLEKPEVFTVRGCGTGHAVVDGRKYPLEREIGMEAGSHHVEVFVGHMTGLPCIYVEGDTVCSDESWMADDFTEMHPVGYSSLYTELTPSPEELCFEEEELEPVSAEEIRGGTLLDFGRMVNGYPRVTLQDPTRCFTLLYGESREEALDRKWCYCKEEDAAEQTHFRRRAFRWLYFEGLSAESFSCTAVHTRVPLRRRAAFSSDNELLNRIWSVAAETYELCGGLFFIDGIKRDRWIWGGDAYQSFCVNPYLLFDREINKRTMRALRGNAPQVQHINTIVDYTMLWILSVGHEYQMDGDVRFLREMYPKMRDTMRLLMSQRDEHGFICGRDRDWIYIDWADIDKEGCISAEQLLLWKSYLVMAECARALADDEAPYAGSERLYEDEMIAADMGAGGAGAGASNSCEYQEEGPGNCLTAEERDPAGRHGGYGRLPKTGPDGRPLPKDEESAAYTPVSAEERALLLHEAETYEAMASRLQEAINTFFWDEEQQAYIDCFVSGRRHVTRHANIFAILFDFVDEARAEAVLTQVLENERIPAITTPYFKFFELDALGKMGRLDTVWEAIHSYWGGMIERGAVTFWEEFDPAKEGAGQYEMYGDPFGKSLCHAWGASPIYLLGKYFLGVRPTSPAYRTYEVQPRTEYFRELDAWVPAGDETVHIRIQDGKAVVETV